MKRATRKCCTCKRVVFVVIPKKHQLAPTLFREVEHREKRPFVLRENKYWCEECWTKHEKEIAG